MTEPPIVDPSQFSPGQKPPRESGNHPTVALSPSRSSRMSGQTSADEARPEQASYQRLLDHRPTIFILLFGVLGFLGIPLLVKSNSFSKREKVVWSFVAIAYTCLLIWGTLAILWWTYSRLGDLLN